MPRIHKELKKKEKKNKKEKEEHQSNDHFFKKIKNLI